MSENITTERNGNVRKKINRLVAKKNGVYIFVDDLFYHDDGFMGATGTRMMGVSKAQHEDELSREKDPKNEYGMMHDFYCIMKRDGTTDLEYEEWLDGFTDWEIEQHLYDPSYSSQYRDTVEEHFENDNPDLEFYTTDCIGGGRMFTNETESYDVIYDQKLLAEVHAIEAEEIPEWVRE